APDAVTLHLISRADDRGSWGEIPAENWVVLTREAWSKLLPTGDVNPGDSWELDRDVTARVLTYFYPQTENNDASTARIEKQSLTPSRGPPRSLPRRAGRSSAPLFGRMFERGQVPVRVQAGV